MDGNKSVDAQFTLNGPYTLTLTTSGTGSGTIQANRTTSLYYGYKVKVWANVSVGSTFAGFTGSLTGTTTPQTLIVDGNEAVNAQFTLNGPYTLTLTKSGTGSGTIQANRTSNLYYGDKVKVWANVSVGSTFAGFTGSLTGNTTPQTLIVDGNEAVDAAFTQNITFKKGFFMGSISNVNTSGDFVTFECKRVRCIWFSPFSVTLQKTGHMVVSMESHGLFAFIGKSVIFGRFSAALTDTVDVVQPLPTITIDEKVPTENAPNSILSPYTS